MSLGLGRCTKGNPLGRGTEINGGLSTVEVSNLEIRSGEEIQRLSAQFLRTN